MLFRVDLSKAEKRLVHIARYFITCLEQRLRVGYEEVDHDGDRQSGGV